MYIFIDEKKLRQELSQEQIDQFKKLSEIPRQNAVTSSRADWM